MNSCLNINNGVNIYSFTNISNVYSRNFTTTDNLLTTVKENKANFTSKEVKQAELVREIQKRLSFESDSSLIRAIKTGSINNLPITIKDVQIAQSIFGSSIAALKGKSTAKPGVIIERIAINRSLDKDQVIFIDLIYINSECFMAALSNPLNLLSTFYLGSGTSTKTSSTLEKILHQNCIYVQKSRFPCTLSSE